MGDAAILERVLLAAKEGDEYALPLGCHNWACFCGQEWVSRVGLGCWLYLVRFI